MEEGGRRLVRRSASRGLARRGGRAIAASLPAPRLERWSAEHLAIAVALRDAVEPDERRGGLHVLPLRARQRTRTAGFDAAKTLGTVCTACSSSLSASALSSASAEGLSSFTLMSCSISCAAPDSGSVRI